MRAAPFTLAAPLQREVAVTCGGCPIYLVGGLDASDQSASGVFALDPATGRLRQLGNLQFPVHDAAGTLGVHRLLVYGGGAATSTDLIQAFDLRTGKASVVGHLPKPLSDLSAAGSYLIGGYDGVAPQRAIYRVSTDMQVRRVGTLPVGLRYAAVAPGATGDLVIAGGESAAGPVSTVYLFDTNSGKVTLLGHMRRALGHASAFVLDGRVFVAGGLNSGGRPMRSVYVIDPSGVRLTTPLARPFSDAAATQSGGVGWILGGWRGQALAQVLRATFTVG